MLTSAEQDNLYAIISAVLGEDRFIKVYKPKFNEATIDVVEKMVEANFQCNIAMRELIVELLGGVSMLSKGWLRKLVKVSRKVLSKVKLNGYGCLVSTKSRWKSAIIGSAI